MVPWALKDENQLIRDYKKFNLNFLLLIGDYLYEVQAFKTQRFSLIFTWAQQY